jgi:hypothetical protein
MNGIVDVIELIRPHLVRQLRQQGGFSSPPQP